MSSIANYASRITAGSNNVRSSILSTITGTYNEQASSPNMQAMWVGNTASQTPANNEHIFTTIGDKVKYTMKNGNTKLKETFMSSGINGQMIITDRSGVRKMYYITNTYDVNGSPALNGQKIGYMLFCSPSATQANRFSDAYILTRKGMVVNPQVVNQMVQQANRWGVKVVPYLSTMSVGGFVPSSLAGGFNYPKPTDELISDLVKYNCYDCSSSSSSSSSSSCSSSSSSSSCSSSSSSSCSSSSSSSSCKKSCKKKKYKKSKHVEIDVIQPNGQIIEQTCDLKAVKGRKGKKVQMVIV
jgi:hypothetical protein